MPSEEVAVFTPDVADRLLELINGKKPAVSTPTHFDFTNCLLAFTELGAGGRVGSTLGTGTATLFSINVDNSIEEIGVDDVEFVNLAVTEVGTNKYILLLRVSGKLVCVWEECA